MNSKTFLVILSFNLIPTFARAGADDTDCYSISFPAVNILPPVGYTLEEYWSMHCTKKRRLMEKMSNPVLFFKSDGYFHAPYVGVGINLDNYELRLVPKSVLMTGEGEMNEFNSTYVGLSFGMNL